MKLHQLVDEFLQPFRRAGVHLTFHYLVDEFLQPSDVGIQELHLANAIRRLARRPDTGGPYGVDGGPTIRTAPVSVQISASSRLPGRVARAWPPPRLVTNPCHVQWDRERGGGGPPDGI